MTTGPATGHWLAYTDGACAPSNPGPSGWGRRAHPARRTRGVRALRLHRSGHHQIAELTAAIEGLSRVPVGAEVELVSDSQYVLKGLSEWRAGWERKGFRNSKGERVANLELWHRLFAAADARKVRVRWVRGHTGDRCNEMADALANRALAHARRVGPLAAGDRRPSGQGALHLQQLEARQREVGAVLFQHRDDEKARVPLQRADQHVARARGRDHLVDRIGQAHAASRRLVRGEHLRRSGRSELHVERLVGARLVGEDEPGCRVHDRAAPRARRA